MKTDFIYLASASPRRSALLEQIGVAHRVLPADISEAREPDEPSERYVMRLAEQKAAAVWKRTRGEQSRPVLAADTTVVLDERVLGKPRDVADALEMLADLSGRSHRVLTGVALRHMGGLTSVLSVSEVRFRPTSEAERRAYCATGEPLDKAGGYGIQGYGAVFVERIKGSFSAVVGLPLRETAALLAQVREPRWLFETGAGA
ncbi:MAG: Maf family nucleotide pyrophosphatase [Gammaproteobacteria bacterium]|nr:Maf family nucleotide pyrophosphatase [Gammaproteobacteria bacterium]MDH3505609.1 Maf family nucleotide pyrophosphatase [Gammaproteobacteria bacterium]